MSMLPVLLVAVSVAMNAPAPKEHIQVSPESVRQGAPLALPAQLREPLAAVARIATGMQANRVCDILTAEESGIIDTQLRDATKTLYVALTNNGFESGKAQQILVRLLDEGENLARNNFPTCTKVAPDIIVKAKQDAECINQYLAGSNLTCFR